MDNVTAILTQEFAKLNDKIDTIYTKLDSRLTILEAKVDKGFKETASMFKNINAKLDRQETINISNAGKMREFEVRLEMLEAKVV